MECHSIHCSVLQDVWKPIADVYLYWTLNTKMLLTLHLFADGYPCIYWTECLSCPSCSSSVTKSSSCDRPVRHVYQCFFPICRWTYRYGWYVWLSLWYLSVMYYTQSPFVPCIYRCAQSGRRTSFGRWEMGVVHRIVYSFSCFLFYLLIYIFIYSCCTVKQTKSYSSKIPQ
jgi:hypothetical protein